MARFFQAPVVKPFDYGFDVPAEFLQKKLDLKQKKQDKAKAAISKHLSDLGKIEAREASKGIASDYLKQSQAEFMDLAYDKDGNVRDMTTSDFKKKYQELANKRALAQSKNGIEYQLKENLRKENEALEDLEKRAKEEKYTDARYKKEKMRIMSKPGLFYKDDEGKTQMYDFQHEFAAHSTEQQKTINEYAKTAAASSTVTTEFMNNYNNMVRQAGMVYDEKTKKYTQANNYDPKMADEILFKTFGTNGGKLIKSIGHGYLATAGTKVLSAIKVYDTAYGMAMEDDKLIADLRQEYIDIQEFSKEPLKETMSEYIANSVDRMAKKSAMSMSFIQQDIRALKDWESAIKMQAAADARLQDKPDKRTIATTSDVVTEKKYFGEFLTDAFTSVADYQSKKSKHSALVNDPNANPNDVKQARKDMQLAYIEQQKAIKMSELPETKHLYMDKVNKAAGVDLFKKGQALIPQLIAITAARNLGLDAKDQMKWRDEFIQYSDDPEMFYSGEVFQNQGLQSFLKNELQKVKPNTFGATVAIASEQIPGVGSSISKGLMEYLQNPTKKEVQGDYSKFVSQAFQSLNKTLDPNNKDNNKYTDINYGMRVDKVGNRDSYLFENIKSSGRRSLELNKWNNLYSSTGTLLDKKAVLQDTLGEMYSEDLARTANFKVKQYSTDVPTEEGLIPLEVEISWKDNKVGSTKEYHKKTTIVHMKPSAANLKEIRRHAIEDITNTLTNNVSKSATEQEIIDASRMIGQVSFGELNLNQYAQILEPIEKDFDTSVIITEEGLNNPNVKQYIPITGNSSTIGSVYKKHSGDRMILKTVAGSNLNQKALKILGMAGIDVKGYDDRIEFNSDQMYTVLGLVDILNDHRETR